MPTIAETVADLKQQLQREREGQRKLRVQMLYLLQRGQATTRQEVAGLLGLSRNTVGRWLTTYETGGMVALLTLYIPAGKPLSLAPEVLSSIEVALHQPHGFESYTDLQAWVKHMHGVSVKYKTLYTIVRTRFNTKLKVPRPSHTKKG
jgi:transposase